MVLVFNSGLSGEEEKKPNRSHREDVLVQARERAGKRGRVRLAAAWVSAFEQRNLKQKRERDASKKLSERAAIWKEFALEERRELELRKNGQLDRLLGEPLPGEPPALLGKLAADDQLQAKRGLVALMSGGKTVYKNIDDLGPEDMPARIAANRLRTTWLKERRDRWLGRWEIPL